VSEKMGKEKAPISSNQFDLMRWGLFLSPFSQTHESTHE